MVLSYAIESQGPPTQTDDAHSHPDRERYSLAAFRDRLRDVCAQNLHGSGNYRARLAQDQTQCAIALARKLGLFREQLVSWAEFREANEDCHFGAEHAVESSDASPWVAKVTIPHRADDPGGGGVSSFGLVPKVINRSWADSRTPVPQVKRTIELVPATPLEYLDRWAATNDVFQDQIQLRAVVQWKGGHVSFVIAQPTYQGEPAHRELIIQCFEAEGWTRITDPSREHLLFYNYAFGILAIDAAARNCYHRDGYLLPLDVILCRPDVEMANFLQLYPDS